MKETLFQLTIATARAAGDEILQVYAQNDLGVETKSDSSPLTEADRRAHKVIVERLDMEFPDIPLLSEESAEIPHEDRKHWTQFWLVDPLDGTKEFIKRNGEFTVNIALISDGKPIAGVVYRPVDDVTYFRAPGGKSYRQEGTAEPVLLEGGAHYSELDSITVVASRSHMSQEVTDFVAGLEAKGKTVAFQAAGSSLKLCLVADGSADIYPRLGPTMEWDTAAAHAIAEGAGRQVLDWETREPLLYNKENLLNPWFVVE